MTPDPSEIEDVMTYLWDNYKCQPEAMYVPRSFVLDRSTDELRASLKKCKGSLKRNVLHVLRRRARAIRRGEIV